MAFNGFSKDSFIFLQDFTKNFTSEWFKQNKNRYDDILRPELISLFEDIADKYIKQARPEFETTAKSTYCIAKINKQPGQREGETLYWNFLWGAFYRKKMKGKSHDLQFFISIHPEYFECGLFLGDAASNSLRKSIKDSVRTKKDKFISLAKSMNGYSFPVVDEPKDPLVEHDNSINNKKDLEEWLNTEKLKVQRKYYFKHDNVIFTSSLVDAVIEDYKRFEPIYSIMINESSEIPNKVNVKGEFNKVDIISLLKKKKQIILYGPPGTGKTYFTKKIAIDIM